MVSSSRHYPTEWKPDEGNIYTNGKIEALSLNGLHIGQHHDGDWVFGSTRWNTTPPTVEEEKQELIQRLRDTLPFSPEMKPTNLVSGRGQEPFMALIECHCAVSYHNTETFSS